MRKSKSTDAQIAFALKQVETGTPVKELIQPSVGLAEVGSRLDSPEQG